MCVVLFSYWENNQSLNVLFEKHENLEIDLMFEVMTLDFNRIVNLLTKLQVVDFVYILFQNTILQCFLSLVFYFIQVLTANDPVHKVSDEFNYRLFLINIIFYECVFFFLYF